MSRASSRIGKGEMESGDEGREREGGREGEREGGERWRWREREKVKEKIFNMDERKRKIKPCAV